MTRQIHEPLVETLVGPYGAVRRVPGLALSVSSAADDTIWSFRIRPGVKFQDGTPLTAGAVQANGNRWLTTSAGRALMPDLFAVDAPRPDLVRFFLDAPDPSFGDLLSLPQTGIVSPKALTNPSGEGAELRRETRTGTGPFELRESDPGEVLVARNLSWWGTERDLGPGARSGPLPGDRRRRRAPGAARAPATCSSPTASGPSRSREAACPAAARRSSPPRETARSASSARCAGSPRATRSPRSPGCGSPGSTPAEAAGAPGWDNTPRGYVC